MNPRLATCTGCGGPLAYVKHDHDENHICALLDCRNCTVRFALQTTLRVVGTAPTEDIGCQGNCCIKRYHTGCRGPECRAIAAAHRQKYRNRDKERRSKAGA